MSSVTDCYDEQILAEYLKKAKWYVSNNKRDIGQATDNFFTNPPPEPKAAAIPKSAPKGASKSGVNFKAIFQIYAGENPKME